jgi:hypothetical protein
MLHVFDVVRKEGCGLLICFILGKNFKFVGHDVERFAASTCFLFIDLEVQ